jgi:hypothetical protein
MERLTIEELAEKHIDVANLPEVTDLPAQCGAKYLSSLGGFAELSKRIESLILSKVMFNRRVSLLFFSDTTDGLGFRNAKEYADSLPAVRNNNSGNNIKFYQITRAHVLQMYRDATEGKKKLAPKRKMKVTAK